MKKLELLFENEDGKTVTYSLDKPIEPVDTVSIRSAMDAVIAGNVFHSSGGNLIAPKGARLVERNVEDIELDVQ